MPQDLKRKSRAWESKRMRVGWAIPFGAASGLIAAVLPMTAAHADPPSSLRVVGQDTGCPSAKQVAAVLERMLPRTKVTAEAGSPTAAETTVSDQGARFRVTVAGQERSFDDGAHQCAERARHAAVFVALVLDPPAISDLSPDAPPAPPAAVPPPPASPPPPPERPPSGRQWDVAFGGVVLVAPEVENRSTAVAQGVAAFARSKRGIHWGVGAGVLHGELRFDVASADAWWFPLDAVVGVSTKATSWELGAELGPNASILSIVGKDLKQAQRQIRVELGGRVSAWSRFWFTKKFAAFLSADCIVRPFPYVLDIDPRGGIGEMPAIWLGASAGLTVMLE